MNIKNKVIELAIQVISEKLETMRLIADQLNENHKWDQFDKILAEVVLFDNIKNELENRLGTF